MWVNWLKRVTFRGGLGWVCVQGGKEVAGPWPSSGGAGLVRGKQTGCRARSLRPRAWPPFPLPPEQPEGSAARVLQAAVGSGGRWSRGMRGVSTWPQTGEVAWGHRPGPCDMLRDQCLTQWLVYGSGWCIAVESVCELLQYRFMEHLLCPRANWRIGTRC